MIDGGQLKSFADTDYRLDGQGERPGQDAGQELAHPPETGVSARQPGKGDPDRLRTS